MAPKKTITSKAQSPSVAQRVLLAEQKRLAKASWKESVTATECGRQRQLLVALLPFSRAVQAAMYEYETIDDEDAVAEQQLKTTVDNAVLLYQQQQLIFAAGVKKGKQFRLLQSLFEKVDFQMRMVYREYASNKDVQKETEDQIALLNSEPSSLAKDIAAAERRLQDTSAIIAFKGQALDLLMTAVMIEDKEFLCRIGTVSPVSTTAELPASGSAIVNDADMYTAAESDQESLDNSAEGSDHMSVDYDDNDNLPGDALPYKRARTASSSSYAEFIRLSNFQE